MATKLRVVSKILECLQETKVAAAGCMLFLKELHHNLPAIGETFSTYFKGGFKSRVYKNSRLENVKSVLSLNFAVSEFIARFSRELPDVRNWPRIHLPTRGETIHPLIIHPEVVKEIFDNEGFQPPENHVILKETIWNMRYKCVINKKGELQVVNDNVINILNRSGQRKTFCELPQATVNLKGTKQFVAALTIDRYDNVFVIIKFKDVTSNKDVYVLFVFDSSGNKRYENLLDLFELDGSWGNIKCRVNNDGELFIHIEGSDRVYVYDKTGTLKSRLTLKQNSSHHKEYFISLQCVTDQNELVMSTFENVLVYTRDGKLKRTIKKEYADGKVTYNHQTSKIEILVGKEKRIGTTTSLSIFSYSENGEVERLYVPVSVKDLEIIPKIFRHPTGPGAIYIYQGYKSHDSLIVFI